MRFRFLLLLPILLAACRTTPVVLDTAKPFHDALARRTNTLGVVKGSEAERAAVQRVKDYFSTMTADSVRAQTRLVYAPEAYLNDTLKSLNGAAVIEDYFLVTVLHAESVTVRFEDVAESGGNYYFRWVMDTRFKKLRAGETLRTIGMTLIRFDAHGRVLLHQDFWDSTAGVFEHVPGVGKAIRGIKAKL